MFLRPRSDFKFLIGWLSNSLPSRPREFNYCGESNSRDKLCCLLRLKPDICVSYAISPQRIGFLIWFIFFEIFIQFQIFFRIFTGLDFLIILECSGIKKRWIYRRQINRSPTPMRAPITGLNPREEDTWEEDMLENTI